ncbi:hypothetical protein PIB30_006170 [Stylosanthes scabra]|uniref:Uncharacterized protein n=1 Tax=Stylosanthes scabra TaxID=79078 RepID=A0ABU6X311_9FABA|nr:hypothetical protein [Stylosanthes scabra]
MYGSWMKVQRMRRGRKGNGSDEGKNAIHTDNNGSRFAALHDEGNADDGIGTDVNPNGSELNENDRPSPDRRTFFSETQLQSLPGGGRGKEVMEARGDKGTRDFSMMVDPCMEGWGQFRKVCRRGKGS